MWWLLCIVIVTILWTWKSRIQKPPGLWEQLGIPFIQPRSIIYTVFHTYFSLKSHTVGQQEIYAAFKDQKYVGTYLAEVPLLSLRDPELIHKILVTDFSIFDSRGSKVNEELDPLQGNMFNLGGEKWRRLRTRLSPALGPARLRALAPGVETLLPHLLSQCSPSPNEVDIRKVTADFTTRVICRAAFGIEADHPRYVEIGRLATRPNPTRAALRLFLRNIVPRLIPAFNIKIYPKELEDFFLNLVRDTVKTREKDDGWGKKDFIKIMMELKNEQHKDEGVLTEKSMAANAMLFYTAGFETTAATLAFCLYELAKNQDIQRRLTEEISGARNGKPVTHDLVKELPYLRMVIDETLRKYPPTLHIIRMCKEEYELPDGNVLPANTRVDIPVFAHHHNPDVYPDPERFDPERFEENNRRNIPKGAYIPFGDGPKICLGMSFALMELKVAISAILSEYKVGLHSRTPRELTFLGGTASFLLQPKETIWLRFESRR